MMRYAPQSEESLTLNAQGDTVDYSLRKYYDKRKRKPVYVRNINNDYVLLEDNDYEEKNEYDGGGNLRKSVQCYFDTGKREPLTSFGDYLMKKPKKDSPYRQGL
ncbi:hypothetical protein SFC43_07755 [Bacteroides sp. CR5/BHMF/2]|nr:hypothetical protein [Bacteroides sp. CR5/BHMF/2]